MCGGMQPPLSEADATALRLVSPRHSRGERPDQRDAELSCRDVFAAAPQPITCIGPVLADAEARVHEGSWKA